MDNIEKFQKIIDESENIVFFGGAGVSTASGIKDFRGKDGLYKEKYDYPPEYFLSCGCLYNQPELFYDFYKNKMNCLDAKPNIVHIYLAELEKKGKLKAIVTQNIDNLHQKAGSKNVLEIHGTVYKNYCSKCMKEYDEKFIFNSDNLPRCECGGLVRPNVVLYGEMLSDAYSKAQYYISKADTVVVAGSSLTVQPASGLVNLFNGKNLVIINNEKTPYDEMATLVINDDLVNIFSRLK